MDVGGGLAGAEGGRGGQGQLLLDQTGLGMVLRQLPHTLLKGLPQEIQPLGRLAQTRLGLAVTGERATREREREKGREREGERE